MKRLVIVFIAAIFLVHFPGLTSVKGQYLIDWSRTHGDKATTECRSVCLTSDNGSVLAGWTIKSDRTDADISLTRLDPSHNGLWFKLYGGTGNEYAYSVKQTPDGGFIIAGETYTAGTGGDAYLIRTDANGDTLWTRKYGIVGHDEMAFSVCMAPNGDFVFTGTDRYQNGNWDDVYVVRAKANGDTLWTRRWDFAHDWDRSAQIQPTIDGGFAIIGHSYFAGPYNLNLTLIKLDSLGNMTWEKPYGVREDQRGGSLQQTSDKGFILVGYTEEPGSHNQDVYAVKTDSLGVVEWQKTYGGSGNDEGRSVVQLTDHGFLITGDTYSFGSGGRDCYVLRLDADGDTVWTKTLGGAADDVGWQVQPTNGGTYLIGGTSASFRENSTDWAGYLAELTDAGALLSEKTYQCEVDFFGREIQRSPAGGYAIAGYVGCHQAYDASLMRLDDDGNLLWMKTYGGGKNDYAYSLKALPDSGFIIAGETYSVVASGEAYLIRTDKNGDTLWTRTYGSAGHDEMAHSVCLAPNGDFVVAGTDKYQDFPYDDVYAFRVSSLGEARWIRSWNFGFDWDRADQIQPTTDGGFAIVGHSYYVGTYTIGVTLIKIDSLGNLSWEKDYGVRTDQRGESLQQTSDKGYILVGYTEEPGFNNKDVYVVKTDSLGEVKWQHAYGGSGNDNGLSVLQFADQSFLIAGISDNARAASQDAYLLHIDSVGTTISTQLIGDAGDENVFSLLPIENDHVIIAGYYTRTDGQSETYLAKLQSPPVDVDDQGGGPSLLPTRFALSQNYPNPFNPQTSIEFALPKASHVVVDIYDITGRLVRTLVNERLTSGLRKVNWDGTDHLGQPVASGVYFYRLKTGEFSESKKMVLLK